MMRAQVILSLVALILISACTVPQNGNTAVPGNTVSIQNFAFSPNTLTVHKGDTVVWTNNDAAPHTVTSDTGSELSSQQLHKGETYSHTFSTAGTFSYHCTVHPMMKATITVV